MWSEGWADIRLGNKCAGDYYNLTPPGWWTCWTCGIHRNRFHGENKGWFADIKLMRVLELEPKFSCHLPPLEMCGVHDISTNYNHKKWTHRDWLGKKLWWVSELVQSWTLSWFGGEIYMLRHKMPAKIIFEM